MNRRMMLRFCIALNRLDGLYALAAGRGTLSENMLFLLYALDSGDALSQKQLSEEWLIPKTTINTLVKELEAEGHVELLPIPGKKRERLIALTDVGRTVARQLLAPLYRAEQAALDKTVAKYTPEFIDALEYYDQCFQEALMKENV